MKKKSYRLALVASFSFSLALSFTLLSFALALTLGFLAAGILLGDGLGLDHIYVGGTERNGAMKNCEFGGGGAMRWLAGAVAWGIRRQGGKRLFWKHSAGISPW